MFTEDVAQLVISLEGDPNERGLRLKRDCLAYDPA